MLSLPRSLKTAGAAAVLAAALWLCAPQAAKAGDGGSLASLQSTIDNICTTSNTPSCPQIPTITQAVLQVAAYFGFPIVDDIRAGNNIIVSSYADAGNMAHPPGCSTPTTPTMGCVDPLSPMNGLPIDSSVLSGLRPLAFAGASNGGSTATPVALPNRSATSFFYAVGASSGATPNPSGPDTLVLFYDAPTRTQGFLAGQIAGKVSLPLTVLNTNGTERAVPAVLTFTNPKPGATPCTVTGNFSGNNNNTRTVSAAQIGVSCAIVVGGSPADSNPHLIFEVTVPMLINPTADPAIVSGGLLKPFSPNGVSGFQPGTGLLGNTGQSIGIGPNSAPFGPPAGTATNPTASYAFCASLATTNGSSALVPSVAAFLAIGGDGEVLASAPLAPSISITCPSL